MMAAMEDLCIPLDEVKSRAGYIYNLPDVWEMDVPTNWLVDGLIAEGAVILLSGESGVGKSTFAIALAGCIANGQPFLGLATTQRRVLVLDRENGAATVRERLKRLGVPRTPNISYWGGWNDRNPAPPTDEMVREFVRREKALLIYDSLIGFHPGSEQDASETRRYMNGYRDLANLGGTVMVVHHTGKGLESKDYRGSSDIKASVDSAFRLERVGDVGGGLNNLRLVNFKERMAAPPEPIQIGYHGHRFILNGRSACPAVSDLDRLRAIVAANPGQSQSSLVELASKAGISKEPTRALLEEGERSGLFAVAHGSRNSKLYSVTTPGG